MSHINDLLHAMFDAFGNLKTILQDQHTPTLIVPFHSTAVSSTVATQVANIDTNPHDVEVALITGFVVGQYITIYNVDNTRFYQGTALAIAGNVISLDSPIDFAFEVGDKISGGSIDLNVDGSVTTQVFSIRLPEPGLSMIGDITRFILVMETLTQPGWNEIGDIVVPALDKGMVLRKVDGAYQNIFNCKSNSELANIMFDFDQIDQAKFSVYGLKGRFTVAGSNKVGVTIRIAVGEDIQLLVQSNYSTLLKFRIYAEGHVVDPS